MNDLTRAKKPHIVTEFTLPQVNDMTASVSAPTPMTWDLALLLRFLDEYSIKQKYFTPYKFTIDGQEKDIKVQLFDVSEIGISAFSTYIEGVTVFISNTLIGADYKPIYKLRNYNDKTNTRILWKPIDFNFEEFVSHKMNPK